MSILTRAGERANHRHLLAVPHHPDGYQAGMMEVRVLLSGLLFVCVTVAPTPALAQNQPSSLIDLGTLGGSFSGIDSATAINDAGQVVGGASRASGEFEDFLLQQRTVMIDLGTLGCAFSSAKAINAAGQVVVRAVTTSGQAHAVLVAPEDAEGDGIAARWLRDNDNNGVNDLMTDLGTLGGNDSEAVAINAAGQVV